MAKLTSGYTTVPNRYDISQYSDVVVVVVLVFYGPSVLCRSFRARSVNLSTPYLGKPPTNYARSYRRRFFAFHYAVNQSHTTIISS